MQLGIPREVKDGEARAGATPDAVQALVAAGHEVVCQAGAGERAGFEDAEYVRAGARLVAAADEVYACPLLVKVKELQPSEWPLLRRGAIILGYQQLARDPRLLEAVLAAGVTCVAGEAVTAADGARPLLAPMSTIAGLLSAPIAAWAVQRRDGPLSGSGVLLSGMEGVPAGRVAVLGCGVAGRAAVRAFLGMGCHVTVFVREAARLPAMTDPAAARAGGELRGEVATPGALAAALARSDVVVGAVAVRGRLSPRLVTRAMLRAMRPGSVLVDLGIDMGGVAETSRQTTLSAPLFVAEGVLHYGVPNVPALVPRTATQALTAATLPYVRLLAERGLAGALAADPGLAEGVQVHGGAVTSAALAEDTGRPWVPLAVP